MTPSAINTHDHLTPNIFDYCFHVNIKPPIKVLLIVKLMGQGVPFYYNVFRQNWL